MVGLDLLLGLKVLHGRLNFRSVVVVSIIDDDKRCENVWKKNLMSKFVGWLGVV